nr:hypothetical protein Iba_chr03aCG15460 [Ipomoea batatas]
METRKYLNQSGTVYLCFLGCETLVPRITSRTGIEHKIFAIAVISFGLEAFGERKDLGRFRAVVSRNLGKEAESSPCGQLRPLVPSDQRDFHQARPLRSQELEAGGIASIGAERSIDVSMA